jgi:hypothetical protein
MTFLKCDASTLRRGCRRALTALTLITATAGFAAFPISQAALADKGSGHGGGEGHDNSGRDDHARGGADDPADHDVGDDHGGAQAHQNGADDPADHDLNDDHGDDSAVIQPAAAN